MSEFHIVIPCKALAEGKSRLASMLSPRQRYELCAAMLRQTIDVAVEIVFAPSPGAISILPITGSKAVTYSRATVVSLTT